MNCLKYIEIVCICCFVVLKSTHAQPCEFYKKQYPFLCCAENKIQYEGESFRMFADFFQKIQKLEQGIMPEHVHILHFGDSHIQADYFPDRMRAKLCEHHNNSSCRGMIFPYTIAQTNNPHSYAVNYSGTWSSVRATVSNTLSQLGLFGMSVSTKDPLAILQISQPQKKCASNAFSRIRVFHTMAANIPKIKLAQDHNLLFQTTNEYYGYSLFILKDPMDSLTFVFDFDQAHSEEITIFGISLENKENGIVYSSLGANGATVKTLQKANLFEKQLLVLDPALVILSYGINDVYHNFQQVEFEANYTMLIKRIRSEFSNVPILLTTPGEALRNRIEKINDMHALVESIYNVAKSNDCAVWNFYSAMGGEGSMNKWYDAGLTNADKLHFLKKGYELQADLLFQVLIQNQQK